MKKLIVFVIATFLFGIRLFAQSDGVVFFNGTFDEAVQKAKAENKFLIIDCLTSW